VVRPPAKDPRCGSARCPPLRSRRRTPSRSHPGRDRRRTGCRSGGIGRRGGLKIRCPQGLEGSSPSFGTAAAFPFTRRLSGSRLLAFARRRSGGPRQDMTRRGSGVPRPVGGRVGVPRDAGSAPDARRMAPKQATRGASATEPTSLRALLARSHAAAAAAGGIAVDSEVWREAVGERIARHARPGRLSRGTLTVHASSSVWAQELSLLSDELKSRLRKEGVEVTGLRFSVTAAIVPANSSVPAAPPRQTGPAKRLPKPLEARLANLEDPELRRVIAEAASESLALQSRRSRAKRPDVRVPQSAARETAQPDRTRSGARAGSPRTRAGRQR
jgi:predicted nucleic acid-binding Zn ribbon protein